VTSGTDLPCGDEAVISKIEEQRQREFRRSL